MQHPHRRWEGFRGDPWVSGLPEPERARGHEPADKAESGEKTLKPLFGETRVTRRKLDCLKSNAIRSIFEFIPIKPLVATGSSAPGSCAGHSRVPSPDHGLLASTGESGLSRCDSASHYY